jgi:hypothetical protein
VRVFQQEEGFVEPFFSEREKDLLIHHDNIASGAEMKHNLRKSSQQRKYSFHTMPPICSLFAPVEE